jgi:hypothetical protein
MYFYSINFKEDHNMKTLFFTAIMGLLISTSVTAKSTETNYFISTAGQLTHFKHITFKHNEIKVVLENGEKLIIPSAQIKTIRAKGKIYDKLPVYKNNEPTTKEVFMELVTTKDGLKLYRYSSDINSDRRTMGFNVNDNYEMENYVVYKDGQFKTEVNDSNYEAIFTFFDVNYR